MKIYKSEPNADLEFHFKDDSFYEELDKQGIPLPKMKLVDFWIERDKDILLVEIKDPSNHSTPESNRADYLKRLIGNELISNELVPKARDSYTYLHLMNLDKKPFKYIVLLGIDSYSSNEQKIVMGAFKERLLSKIRWEAKEPWKKQYIEDCFAMSIETWNKKFPEWEVIRISKERTNVK